MIQFALLLVLLLDIYRYTTCNRKVATIEM